MKSMKKKIFNKAMFLLLAFTLMLPMNLGVAAADECCGGHSGENVRTVEKEIGDLHADECCGHEHSEEGVRTIKKEIGDLHGTECCDHEHSEDDDKKPEDEDEPSVPRSTQCQMGHALGMPTSVHEGNPCKVNTYQSCTRSGCTYKVLLSSSTCSNPSHTPPITECVHPGSPPGFTCSKCKNFIGAGSCPLCHMC